MNVLNTIIEKAKENNGVITTAMITKLGFSRGNLQYLVKKGMLDKSSRGVYILPEILDDEFLNLQTKYKRGVFSLETALFLLDLTDRTPNIFNMSFPATYNLTNAKEENIECNNAKMEIYELGIIKTLTPNGNWVNAYNIERTLCDILRKSNSVSIEVIVDSFKQYALRRDKNIPLLSEYAKRLKVEKKLRSYLEVLL